MIYRGLPARRSYASALSVLALASTVALAPLARAQDAEPALGNLRFVGTQSDRPPSEWLEQEDLDLLFACRRPMTLSQVLAQGIAFRSSRIEKLQGAGLLTQRGQQFVSLLPIWTADDESLNNALDNLAAPIVAAILPEFRRLERTLRDLGYPEALPALATWIVQERVWDELIASGMIDLRGMIGQQEQAYANRGWWGVLWYDASGGPQGQLLAARGANDRTMLLSWAGEAPPAALDTDNPYGWLAEIVAAVRNDRLEIRGSDELRDELYLLGLLSPERHLNAPLVEWDPQAPRADDEEGEREADLSTSVQALTELLAVTVTGQLASSWIPPALSSASPVTARTIAYRGLAPRILAGLTEAGVRATVDPQGPIATTVPGTGPDDEPERRPQRVSVFFWKDLPRALQRPSIPLR